MLQMGGRAPNWYMDSSPNSCMFRLTGLLGLAVNLLVLLGLTHLCFPRARRHTRKFFELSYYNRESGNYTQGWDDAYMVFYWMVLFTGLRASVMDFVLIPFARWGGVEGKKATTRFAEQAWLMIYASTFWSIGMVKMFSVTSLMGADFPLVYHV
jgi:acyl-CoA-dependent ceramide synthase